MHGHDGFGAPRDGPFNELRVEIERGVINIHIDRVRPDIGNRPTGGHERERRGDNFVAGANAEQQHGHVQRRGAAVETDAMFRADKSGKVFFKLRHVRSQAEGALVNGARDGGVKVLADIPQLGRQVEIGNWVSHFEEKIVCPRRFEQSQICVAAILPAKSSPVLRLTANLAGNAQNPVKSLQDLIRLDGLHARMSLLTDRGIQELGVADAGTADNHLFFLVDWSGVKE